MIPTLPANTDIEEIANELSRTGVVVVTELFDASLRDKVRSELAPFMAKSRVMDEDDPSDFFPSKTRRMSALVTHSNTVGDMILDPHTQALCDRVLLPNGEYGHQLHITAALEIGPGARRQILHRDHQSFSFFPDPKPNIVLAAMWAVTDFRADNGATLLVPGSHAWEKSRTPKESEVFAAEMPAGSVMFWLGGTLHGAGANVSSDWRYGITLGYSVGWVRQEENIYLDVPPERAAELSPALRKAIGYTTYRALGYSARRDVKLVQDL
ncbi:MAG: hypothetical protein GKR90_07330 [Pseudomonadales bacterium]|nr:hypothetical protein [Pseudomonadales bacterium]